MIVLAGDTNQWKRSAIDSRAIGPPSGSPRATRSMAMRCGRTLAGSVSGARAARRPSSSSVRAPMYDFERQSRTTPALRHSPRSTRGTTRMMAYWYGLRGSSGTFGLLHEGTPPRQPPLQVADVGGTLLVGTAGGRVVGQPHIGDGADEALEQGAVEGPGQARIGPV